METGYFVLSYDLIGRGFSQYASNGLFGLDEHLEQLHTIVENISASEELDSVHIVGHSQGGAITLGYGAKYGGTNPKLQSIILLAPAGVMTHYSLSLLQGVGCIQSIVKSFLMDPAAQRREWKSGFVNPEGPVSQEMIEYFIL